MGRLLGICANIFFHFFCSNEYIGFLPCVVKGSSQSINLTIVRYVMATSVKNEINSDPEESGNTINLADCDARIAELACYKAESRGLEPGYELNDWLFEAEQKFML
jgi:hypothetical protein